MENKNFSLTIQFSKTPKDIYNQINDVSKWWATKEFNGIIEGHSTNLNDEFVVRFGDVHYSKQKLIEVIPNRKVVWLVIDSKINWIEKDKTEWTNTKIIFEIVSKGNISELHFTHEGLIPKLECYEKCIQGWNMIIKTSLEQSLNKAK